MTTTNSKFANDKQVHERIREVFQQQYTDLGILRWLNRNKSTIKITLGSTFLATLAIAFLGNSWPLAIWAFMFIGTIWLGGVDHFFIGIKLKRILNTLEQEGISISLTTLQEICKDVMPQ